MTLPTRIATGIFRLDTTVTGTAMPLAIYLIEGERFGLSARAPLAVERKAP